MPLDGECSVGEGWNCVGGGVIEGDILQGKLRCRWIVWGWRK